MIITGKSIGRRAFLRGTGAALALPLLDAMTPALAVEAPRPVRLGFIVVPNGIMNLNHEFAPKAAGPLTELTPILQPLADFKDRMLVVSGCDNQQAAGLNFEIAGDHPRACTAWLTASHARMTSGADLKAGISADQIAASEFSKYTQLASLEVGLESTEMIGSCEAAYSCAYYNTIAWRDDTTPLPMENRPRAIFERLFGAAGTTDPKVREILRQEDRSILDAVNQDVKRLRGKLGGADRGKIDQYLEAVRDVERRIQLAEAQSKDHPVPALEGPGGIPTVFSEYYRLMTDLMVLAWQTDMTRVTTFQVGHEMGGRAYPEVGFGDSHHSVTHHHGDPEKIAKTTKINIFHTKMLAYYLDKLRSTPDGDGSLLDHSLMLYGAALSDGNLHLYTDLPLVLFTSGIGGVKGGRHLRFPARTPMANLLLTMLDKAGVQHVEKLGDSTGRLDLTAMS
ncbi:MAG: DUF1552 domain-containing protein [Bradyrhizobiaceae bacterium]|nr:DUF1552 domain-containing protein [Bradyrhizobiaceae bacterium]